MSNHLHLLRIDTEDAKLLAALAKELGPKSAELSSAAMASQMKFLPESAASSKEMLPYTTAVVRDFFKALAAKKLEAFMRHLASETPFIYSRVPFHRVNSWFYFVSAEITAQTRRLILAGKLPLKTCEVLERVFHNLRTVLLMKYLDYEA